MNELRPILNEETHTYILPDGRTPPGVNKVLDLYFPPCGFYTEDGKVIGKVRHQWFHALAQGIELENEPDPRIAGAVGGFKRFMEEMKPVYVSGEERYYDHLRGVCGTPDLVAEVKNRLAIIDYKPENRNKRTPVQTAAYMAMLLWNKVRVLDRYELRLHDDGTYRLRQHTDDDDLKRWAAMASGYHAHTHYL
jgi:hypothetical protein